MTTSLEVRRTPDNSFECDWGELQMLVHAHDFVVSHLVFITTGYLRVLHLIRELVPELDDSPGYSATIGPDGTQYLHYRERDGRRWTWQLHDAHIVQDPGAPKIMVGRWPD